MVQLLGAGVFEPCSQEPRRVIDEIGRPGKGVDVACPTKPLISLGAVGGNAQEVPSHAPEDVLVQFADERVGTSKVPRPLHIRMHDDGGHGIFIKRRVRRPAIDLHVAESVKGKRGLPLLDALAREGEMICCLGLA